MSDNQRRIYCRLIFLLVCVLPTSVTGYWICHPQTPEGWAQAIQAEFGVETEIGSIETPSPFETILRDVRFHDGDETLFETAEARISFGDRNRIVIPYQVKSLNRLGLTYLLDRMNQHVLRSGGPDKIWRIDFEKDTIVDRFTLAELQRRSENLNRDLQHVDLLWQQKNQLIVSGLRIDVAPTAAGNSATAYFHVREVFGQPGDGKATAPITPETMIIEIDTQQVSNRTGSHATEQALKLNTHRGRLPIWLVDGINPQVVLSLGGQSMFEGKLEMTTSAGRVDELVGLFSNVDVSNYYQGESDPEGATIHVRECQYVEGRLTQWVAMISTPTIPPTPIMKSDLYVQVEQIALKEALAKAVLLGRQRYAEIPNGNRF